MESIKLLPELIIKETSLRRRPALIFKDKRISYAELAELVDKFSSLLKQKGVSPQDRIGILLRNSVQFVVSFFSIIKLGAVAVPLNFMLKEEELKPILEEAEIKLLISQEEFAPLLERLRLRVESLKEFIFWPDDVYSLLKKVPPLKKEVQLQPDQLAVLIYTSGSTGRPKGVMLSHRNLLSNIESSLKAVSFSPRERILCLLPLFHSFSLTVCLLLPLYVGGTSLLLDSIRPLGRVIRSIVKERVTVFVGIPQLYQLLSQLKLPWLFKFSLFRKLILKIRFCISGAAPLPLEVLEEFNSKFKIPLLEGYGLSEASPVVSLNPIEKPKPGSVGRAVPGVEIKIVDEAGIEVPAGDAGELLVKGPNVMLGYYKNPQATQQTIKAGWLYTGDIARVDSEGYIYILDRKKDLIIVRGLNVYPREIEEAIYQRPEVKEVAVIGREDKRKGEVPVAYLVLKEGAELASQELLKFLRSRLASYKIPAEIEFRKELPKTPSGKIAKQKLKAEIEATGS